MMKNINSLDYEEAFIVKGCTKMESQTMQLVLRNSFKEECSIEFESELSCNDWKDLILNKALEIDAFLKKETFEIANSGIVKRSSLNEKKKEVMIAE
jgi:hypothetical protein